MLDGFMLDWAAHGLVLHRHIPWLYDWIDSRFSRKQCSIDCPLDVPLGSQCRNPIVLGGSDHRLDGDRAHIPELHP